MLLARAKEAHRQFYQYFSYLYSLPGVSKVYNPFVAWSATRVDFAPPGGIHCHAMGSWDPDYWITCDQCGWGKNGGTDHVDIDGIPNIILCRWCFEVPDPPFWTTRSRTKHFLENMRVLPEPLLRDGLCVDLVTEYLFQLYGEVD